VDRSLDRGRDPPRRVGQQGHRALSAELRVGALRTLVELDIEYRHLAEAAGVAKYVRVPAVGTHPQFIGGLASLVQAALWSTKS
jgi:hypothetical protein